MVTRCLATSRRRLRRPICCRNGSNNHNNYNKLALRLAVGNFAKSERRLRGSRFASWRKTSSLTTTWRGFVDTRSQSPWILPRDRYISNIFAFHHSSFHFFAKKSRLTHDRLTLNSWDRDGHVLEHGALATNFRLHAAHGMYDIYVTLPAKRGSDPRPWELN